MAWKRSRVRVPVAPPLRGLRGFRSMGLHQTEMKKYLRSVVIIILWWQVARLRVKYSPVVIGVAGSVGKTSTKTAIAKVLEKKYKVAWQEGNYNDVVSIPLVFFQRSIPSVFNLFAWMFLFIKNEISIQRGYDYEVVVAELGTDHAGDMAQLRGLLTLDYCVLTAITPEHMAGFTDLDDVAKDELVATELAENLIIDKEGVPEKYTEKLSNPITISLNNGDCVIEPGELNKAGREAKFRFEDKFYEVTTKIIGIHNLSALAFAVTMARILEIDDTSIKVVLESIEPVNGRMQILDGVNGAILIDDTYNSSPKAAISALDTLYELTTKSKIAILGQMNEMGDFSRQYHQEVGEYCDPEQLNLVVTIGEDANKYLAEKAEENHCKVIRCSSPYHAGELIKPILTKDTAVLVKGSQNSVFAEEAVKLLLNDSSDETKLVRQSPKWQKIKRRQFRNVL